MTGFATKADGSGSGVPEPSARRALLALCLALAFALLGGCRTVRPDDGGSGPVLTPRPTPEQLAQTGLLEAEQLVQAGDHREALARLDAVPLPPRPEDRERWLDATVVAAFHVGDLPRVSRAFDAAAEPGPDAPERLEALLDARIGPGVAVRLAMGADTADPLGRYVVRRAVRELFGDGRSEEAAALMRAVLDAGVADLALRGELESQLRRMEAQAGGDAWRLGVLLPLTGPYQAIGQSALRSVQLALGDHGRDVQLAVRDTRGDAARAAEEAEQLVLTDRVAAIVGPVGAKESAETAAVLDELGVPQMVLSSVADLTQGEDVWTFRVRATDRQVLGEVLRRAQGMGLSTLAVLHPDTSYGRQLAGLARDLATESGLTPVAAVAYPAGQGDFRAAIKALKGACQGRWPDALLIADTGDIARRVASYLKAASVPLRTAPTAKGVQLLGVSGWLDPRVVDLAEHTTDNAVFVAPFYPDPSDARARAFVEAFIARFAEGPTPFEAETYDSVRVLLDAMDRVEGGADRERLREALRATTGFVGVTGVLSLRADGTATRLLPVLTVDGGGIRLRGSEDEERATWGAP